MSDITRSKKINVVLIILGSVAVIFVVFSLGIYVGYRKALFAAGKSQDYYRDFFGAAPMGFMAGMPGATHGIAGTVIDIAGPNITVKDQNNDEESVEVSSDTVIRRMSATIDEDGIVIGDSVTVIGEPTDAGQIEARFIRVFSSSSSLPLPPPMSGSGAAPPGSSSEM